MLSLLRGVPSSVRDRLCLGLILCSLCLLPVHAEPGRIVRVGGFDNHPIVFQDENGRLRGMAIEVLEHIAQQEGWTLQYTYGPWQDVLMALEQGEIDILVGIAWSRAREEKFDFTNEVLLNNWGVVLQGEGQRISSLEQLAGKRVALMGRSIHSTVFRDTMQRFDFNFIEVTVPTYVDSLMAVQNGDADAAVVNRVFSLLHRTNYSTKETGIIFNPVEVRYAGHKGSVLDIIQRIDVRLGQAKANANSYYYKALANWLSDRVQRQWPTREIIWLALVGLLILLIIAAHNVILSRQVRRRTAALAESESKFRQLAETINEVFFLVSPDWRKVFYISPAYETVWGLSCDSLYKNPQSWLDYIHPDDKAQVLADINEKITNNAKSPAFHEYRIVRRDSSVRWILVRVYPIHDAKGELYRVAGIAEDVTERRQLDLALNESRRMLQTILDTIPTRVFWKDKDCVYLGCNRMFARDAGFESAADIIGKTDFDFKWAEQAKSYRRDDRDVMQRGQPKLSYEERQTTPTGEVLWLETSKIPLTDTQGNLNGILGTYNDITARKTAEQALKASEERFELAAKGSTDGLWDWTDVNKQEVWWSARLFELLGYKDNEITPSFGFFEELLYPEDRERVIQAVERHLADRAVYDIEFRCRTKQGEYRWFRARGQAIWDEQGKPLRMSGSVQDITIQRLAEEALARSKAEFEAIFNSISDAVIYADQHRTIVLVNPAVEIIFGYSPNELIGKKAAVVYASKTDYEQQGTRQFNVHSKIKNAMYEMLYRRKDGSTFIGETLGTKVFDTQGNVIGLLGIIRDVTERNRAEKELQAHRERLEELVEERTKKIETINRELEAFSYSVSHDLRAPLRAIDGFSDALHEEYAHLLDKAGKEYLERVRNAAQRMSVLIDELLKLSRVTRSELEWQTVNLSELAEIAINRHRDAEPDRQVAITIQPGLMVSGDKHLLQILMDNLIDNAWKYTRVVAQPNIEVGRQEIGGQTAFYVRDNGAGFDMRFVNKLFKPFQRLHAVEDFEGTGIGLATVQRIINRHGGSIWAESEPGQGAQFYFCLESAFYKNGNFPTSRLSNG